MSIKAEHFIYIGKSGHTCSEELKEDEVPTSQ